MSDEIDDWNDVTDQAWFKLKTVPMFLVYVTRPTRVCPLSISSLLAICDRNDLILAKFSWPILPDSSTTKTMSMRQSTGTRGSTGGGGSPATTYHDHIILLGEGDAIRFTSAKLPCGLGNFEACH